MLKRLQSRFLKRRIEKNLSQRDISHRNSKLEHLGFLVHEDFLDNLEVFHDFGIELGLNGKNIRVFTFIEAGKRVPTLQPNQISNKDFRRRGKILNQNAEEFLTFPFDTLIGVYKKPHRFLDVMVSQSHARFKIGFKGSDERLFDLILDVDAKDSRLFKTEIKKYLKIFKKI